MDKSYNSLIQHFTKQYVVSIGDKSNIDRPKHEPIYQCQKNEVWFVLISHDDTRLALGGKIIKVRNRKMNDYLKSFEAHLNEVIALFQL